MFSALVDAVNKNEVREIERMLGEKCYKVWLLQGALKAAGENNNNICVKLLLKKVFYRGNINRALMWVFRGAVNNELDEYMRLVQMLKPSYSSAPSVSLYCAAEAGFVDWIEPLLACGADIDSVYDDKVFGQASGRDDAQCVNSLSQAASRGDLQCVNKLLLYGADVNKGGLNNPPLARAIKNSHIDCVNTLLEADANANERNKNRRSILHDSAARGQLQCVTALLNNGAHVNARDWWKQTPLHHAAGYDQKGKQDECIRVLLQHGAHLNSPDLGGNTPLHLAAEKGNVDTFKMLVQCGASTTQKNKWPRTPLEVADQATKEEMRCIVKEYEWSFFKRVTHPALESIDADHDVNTKKYNRITAKLGNVMSALSKLKLQFRDVRNQNTQIKGRVNELEKQQSAAAADMRQQRHDHEALKHDCEALQNRIDTEVADVNAKIRQVASEHITLELQAKIKQLPHAIHISKLLFRHECSNNFDNLYKAITLVWTFL